MLLQFHIGINHFKSQLACAIAALLTLLLICFSLLGYRLTIHRGRQRVEGTGTGCTGLSNRGMIYISPGQLLVWKHSKTIFYGKKKCWNCIRSLQYWPHNCVTSHVLMLYVCGSQQSTNCRHILCVMVPYFTGWKVSMVQEIILCPILLLWPLGLSEDFLMKIRRHKVRIVILYLQVFLFKLNYATWQLFLVRRLQKSLLWRKSKTWKFTEGNAEWVCAAIIME